MEPSWSEPCPGSEAMTMPTESSIWTYLSCSVSIVTSPSSVTVTWIEKFWTSSVKLTVCCVMVGVDVIVTTTYSGELDWKFLDLTAWNIFIDAKLLCANRLDELDSILEPRVIMTAPGDDTLHVGFGSAVRIYGVYIISEWSFEVPLSFSSNNNSLPSFS